MTRRRANDLGPRSSARRRREVTKPSRVRRRGRARVRDAGGTLPAPPDGGAPMRDLATRRTIGSKTSAGAARAASGAARTAALALAFVAIVAAGCDQGSPAGDGDTGAVGLALVVAPGVTLDG